MSGYLYIALCEDDCIARYTLDEGFPKKREDFRMTGGPFPMALHPSGELLFVGLRKSHELACVRVRPSEELKGPDEPEELEGLDRPQELEGLQALELVAKASLPSDPCFIGMDHQGRYLFITYYDTGQITVHRFEPADKSHQDNFQDNHNVSFQEIQRLETDKNAHSLWLDSDEHYAFAPHTGPNKIYLFTFDNDTGFLTPRTPPYFSPEAYLQPRHLCFHPALPYIYVVNEVSSTISAYRFNKQNGDIDIIQTIFTVPEDARKIVHTHKIPHMGNWCAEIRISPDGNFLYASNRGHDSIACFAVDRENGCVASIGHISTAAFPWSFDLSQDGRFMYVAGYNSGELVSYGIDNRTGMPHEIAREYAGRCPMWVMTSA